ncbi:sensor domain-containing diguanylate cyclase [Alteromonas gilva]|uniref:diguanylate cyclase n=1 Tax=Alteromonas gilva TaxID=2987522 RepID=A0ABT5L5L6_9ALTE|nr:diguanylate cyclase [Alteromonas gilva]MDC8832168.1 diguanylate cyclase [Alteromonas gilva]
MQLFASTTRATEKWLFSITSVMVIAILIVIAQVTSKNHGGNYRPTLYSYQSQTGVEFDQIRALSEDSWAEVDNPASFGFSEQVHWLRFDLASANTAKNTSYIEMDYPLLDNIDVWIEQAGEQQQIFSGGDARPFSQRPRQYHGFLIPLPDSEQPVRVYIRVSSTSVIKVPVTIWQRVAFGQHVSSVNLVMGLFFGLLLAMGLSNLFFFFTTKNFTFLYYSGYVVCLGLTLATLHGYSYKYLWPEQVWFQAKAVSFLASATLMFAVIFSSALLEVRRHSMRADKYLKALMLAFAGLTVSSLVIDYAISIKLFLVLLTIVVFLIMGVVIWLSYRKIIIARYYTLAWGALLISAFSASLDNLGIISVNVPSHVLLVYGATIEALMLALILAIGYSRQREQMFKAQEDALEQERSALEAKQALIDVQMRSQNELEYNVQERTLELEIALRELSEANRELEKLNTIDPLTGIRNRRHFDKRVIAEGRRSRREQTPLALAMLDIDHFKQVNDQYGHSVGDACITHVASLLQEMLKRPSDDVCRYGGEEFVIILPNTDIEGAYQLIESMRQVVEQSPCHCDGHTVPLTLSGGVASAVISRDEGHARLLKLADERLYMAKQAGRNRVVANPKPK